MTPSMIIAALTAALILSLGVSAVQYVQRQRDRHRLAFQLDDLETLDRKNKESLSREGSLQLKLNNLTERAAVLEQQNASLSARVREHSARARSLQASLSEQSARLQSKLEEQTQTISRQWAGLRLQKELIEQARSALGVLGIKLSGQPQEPLAAGRRGTTRLALAELLAEASVDTAALIDERGLSLLGAGRDEDIDRLARFGALASSARAAFEPALGAPMLQWSVRSQARGIHLLSMDPTRWLALAGEPKAPRTALLMTSLKMMGRLPDNVGPVEHLFIDEEPESRQWSAELVSLSEEWRGRWSASSVVIVDGSGQVLSASPGRLPRNLVSARSALKALWTRLHRDGWDLSTTEVAVTASHQGALTAKLTEDRADAPAVLIFAEKPLPDEALDELYASLRWTLGRSRSRAAV
ncbi:MAG: hypothetical protein AAFV53_43285 [Myxococcota bacterium]